MKRLPYLVAAASFLIGAAVVAQEAQYEGKLSAIEKTRIQVTRADKATPKEIWVAIADDTPVIEGDRTTTFAAAKLKKNAMLVVTVAKPDGPPVREWSCTMHTHVAEAGPGKCPVCGMALAERDRADQAKEIRVTRR